MGTITRSFANLITASGPSAVADGSITTADITGNLNFRNIVINGDMQIAQRGQQTNLATGYTVCDRFALYNSGTSVQFTTDKDTNVPSGQNFTSSLKLTLTTADSSITGNNEVQLYQNIEAQNLQYLGFGTSSAKPLVLSFWVKSSVTGNYVLWIYKPDTTTKQIAKLYNITSADTWQKITFEIPALTDNGAIIENDNGIGLSIVWQLAAGSDWTSGTLPTSWQNLINTNRYVGQNNTFIGTTNATFFLTGVQLEAGTSATDFEFLPIDVSLGRCQRYYYLHAKGTDKHISMGALYSSTLLTVGLQFPTEMRTAPSLIQTSGTNYYVAYHNNTVDTFNNFSSGIQRTSTTACAMDTNENISGTAGNAVSVATNNASAFIAYDSEL